MLDCYRKLRELLAQNERRSAFLVLVISIIVALVEALGVASILPFMAVASNPELIKTNSALSSLYERLGFQSQDSFLVFLGACAFFVLIVSLGAKALGFYLQVRFSNMRNHTLAYRMVEAYLRRPYYWHLNRHTAEISGKILSEVSQVVHGVLFPAMQIVAQIFVVLFLVVLVVFVDFKLACIVFFSLTGAYALVYVLNRRRVGLDGEFRVDANKERYRVVQEAFGGIKELKIAGKESVFLERFKVPSEQLARSSVSAKIIGEFPSFAMQAIVFGGMLLMMIFLIFSKGGLQEAIPVLALYAFAGYRLMPALQTIYKQLSEIRYNEASLNALLGDIQAFGFGELEQLTLSESSLKKLRFGDSVVLTDVCYKYPSSGSYALKGLNIKIDCRTKVGLVGASGSGKTTTMDLILGLLTPDSGQIAVDGKPITKSNVREWQNNLGYVPQHIYLTDESIACNIAFGVPIESIDMASVERAAKAANLHDFVVGELEFGYQTVVGERGIRLSGGQRQRIGIARALYHDPEILLLDEATSALDNLTEKAVMEAVENLGGYKTIVLIAHRLSTVKSCDSIYFLDKGRVLAQGTFDDLVKNNEKFAIMAAGK